MLSDDTYIARLLHQRGDWDAALAALGDRTDRAAKEVRADICFERYFFRMEGREEAEAAVEAVDPETVWGRYLRGKAAYSRLLFKAEPRPDDVATAERGYLAAAEDESLRGWSDFHLGVLKDNIVEDAAAAVALYQSALAIAHSQGDLYLESYAARQLSAHADSTAEKLALLRRSLVLRATTGARPQTAAAMVALAQELAKDDPERALLGAAAGAVAEELGLAWVLQGVKAL